MHAVQEKILHLSSAKNLGELTLKQIGEAVGVDHPQKVKHHLEQLAKKGLIKIDKQRNLIESVKRGEVVNSKIVNIPIVGSANCGPANIYAEENIQGYLQVSETLLGYNKNYSNLFALRAVGHSMNRANINRQSIDDGDYVVVDPTKRMPQNGEYILSIIDGCANIKKYYQDNENEQIVLYSQSTQDIAPIFIHPSDLDDYMVNGSVIRVIKNPNITFN